jgi:hypothetical protein
MGKGDLTDQFTRVRMMEAHVAHLNGLDDGYLVWTEIMRYRMDGASAWASRNSP